MNGSERNERKTGIDEVLRKVAAPLVDVTQTVGWWRQVARQRRALAEMDECRLSDIGISRGEALQEARRPFWDVPPRTAAVDAAAGSVCSGGGSRSRRMIPPRRCVVRV